MRVILAATLISRARMVAITAVQCQPLAACDGSRLPAPALSSGASLSLKVTAFAAIQTSTDQGMSNLTATARRVGPASAAIPRHQLDSYE
jgi:hypothetical protein